MTGRRRASTPRFCSGKIACAYRIPARSGFSDTPSVVASTSWGNTITRICTWARFVDRDGRAFWHFNVHLDHISQPSREKSTLLLAQRMAERRNLDEPAIVTGDFNVGEDNPAIATLGVPRVAAGADAGYVPRSISRRESRRHVQ
jgi:endonuclease/exonuclease/phosphatase family metal-dependent hydrolase